MLVKEAILRRFDELTFDAILFVRSSARWPIDVPEIEISDKAYMTVFRGTYIFEELIQVIVVLLGRFWNCRASVKTTKNQNESKLKMVED